MIYPTQIILFNSCLGKPIGCGFMLTPMHDNLKIVLVVVAYLSIIRHLIAQRSINTEDKKEKTIGRDKLESKSLEIGERLRS